MNINYKTDTQQTNKRKNNMKKLKKNELIEQKHGFGGDPFRIVKYTKTRIVGSSHGYELRVLSDNETLTVSLNGVVVSSVKMIDENKAVAKALELLPNYATKYQDFNEILFRVVWDNWQNDTLNKYTG